MLPKRHSHGDRHKRRFGALVVLFSMWWLLFLAPNRAAAQHFSFAQFGQTDGLLNQDVVALTEDSRGVLWVGTQNGVFRADGSHFVPVSAYQDAQYGVVTAMHGDTQGRIWILGMKGLSYFDSDGTLHGVPQFRSMVELNYVATLASMPDGSGDEALTVGGRLYRIASRDGGAHWLVRNLLGPDVLAEHPSLGAVHGMTADPKHGRLWVGCGLAICSLQLTQAGLRATEWGSDQGVSPDSWRTLLLSRDGRLWARSPRRVMQLNPQTEAVKDYGDPSGGAQPFTNFPDLTEDPQGGIIANLQDGIARVEADGNWRVFTSRNGLPPSELIRIYFDRQGGFWLCAAGSGVWRWLGYNTWEAWTRQEGLSGNVSWDLLHIPGKRVLVATDDGLNEIDSANATVRALTPEIAVPQSQALASDGLGGVWVGTGAGKLLHLDIAQHHARMIASSLGFVYQLFAEHGGPNASTDEVRRLWVCTSNGLGIVSGEDNWQSLHMLRGEGVPRGEIYDVKQARDGAIYFSASNGLWRFAHGAWTAIQLPPSMVRTGQMVFSFGLDGSMWLQSALPAPLTHVRLQGATAVLLDTVSSNVISTDAIYSLETDRRGWLWVGTDQGLYVLNGRRWVRCTEEDGLISDDTDFGGLLEDVDGSMWIATARGVSHLLHPESLFAVLPPRINLSEVRLNQAQLTQDVHEHFGFRRPNLSVQLFSTQYLRPRAIRYRYRLLGMEDTWLNVSNRGIHLSALPPGDYNLSIQAIDGRTYEVANPINFPFTIDPPWWQRVWFHVLEGLILLILALTLWQISVRRLKSSKVQLKRLVDLRTAQLMAEKSALEEAQRELQKTMRRDSLTGLLNRAAIFSEMERLRLEAIEKNTSLIVCMADLDHFKAINDQLGHAAGDSVLRVCAERLMNVLRPSDHVGRYGGEELLIVIPGLPIEHAQNRLEEIRMSICGSPIIWDGLAIQVTCSFGVAVLDGGAQEISELLHEADAALYQAKQNGRNCVMVASQDRSAPLRSA